MHVMFVLIGLTMGAQAQPAPTEIPHPNVENTQIIGASLTTVGVVFVVPSTALLVVWSGQRCRGVGCVDATLAMLGARTLGTAMMAGGVPLMVRGRRRALRNERARASVVVLPEFGQRTGVRVTGRF